MIVAERGDRIQFVTQPAHAELAGLFAEHWGGGRFERPEPFAPVALATRAHDDGWQRYDRRPRLDGRTLVDFTGVPAETWTALYDAGIEGVVDADPAAGLLVSLHGVGLQRGWYGLYGGDPTPDPPFAEFVDRQESLQRRLLADLRSGSRGGWLTDSDDRLLRALHDRGRPPEDHGSRLWHNYLLLQVWDRLSLGLCTRAPPPERTEIGPVPSSVGSSGEPVTLERTGNGEYTVEPYPFDRSPLTGQVPIRIVPEDAVREGATSLLSAYYAADRSWLTFEFRPSH